MEAGKDYLRVINIDNEKHTQLQNELDTHFAE